MIPAKFAKLSAAVSDAFRSRNDNHNADRLFTTVVEAKDEIDPVAQVFSRRVMQIRRIVVKLKGAEGRFKKMLLKYANKNKKNGKWPSWYHDNDDHTFGLPHAKLTASSRATRSAYSFPCFCLLRWTSTHWPSFDVSP
jgi:hypothetical protein